MDARLSRTLLVAALLAASLGASYPTPNFLIETRDPGRAAVYGQTAERLRRELAIAWVTQVLLSFEAPLLKSPTEFTGTSDWRQQRSEFQKILGAEDTERLFKILDTVRGYAGHLPVLSL